MLFSRIRIQFGKKVIISSSYFASCNNFRIIREPFCKSDPQLYHPNPVPPETPKIIDSGQNQQMREDESETRKKSREN